MGTSRLKNKDLGKLCSSNKVRSLAIDILNKHFKHNSKAEKLKLLEDVVTNPEKFENHETLGKIANEYIAKITPATGKEYRLIEERKPFEVFGKPQISDNTILQMEMAMQLPITVDGALMPDAHSGYGLPIGGVLATENAVIPYGVGMDIGCRMALSIFNESSAFIGRYAHQIKVALQECTHFGIGKENDLPEEEHEVLERTEFKEIPFLKKLQGKAARQLGSSGSGNHFVEVGVVTLPANNPFHMVEGEYVGLLSHSGSRGLGAEIARYYTDLAMNTCYLPSNAKHLAWLDLQSEAGLEYWIAMNLAGDYAKACHDTIHSRISKALGVKVAARVENHHNFAWKEVHGGKELIVHRKGATPANKGEMGIIPATMLHPGYIVSGKGNEKSLNSASHGAGRKLSRNKAKTSISKSEMTKMLKQAGITLIGGSTDESPLAYKNLEEVMICQQELVKIEGSFHPKIVRMDRG